MIDDAFDRPPNPGLDPQLPRPDAPFYPGASADLPPFARRAILHRQDSRLHSLQALMTVCKGVIPVLASGVLAQMTVTVPRLLIPGLVAKFADVKFVEERWWLDGKVWTSGGVSNGSDMMAAFAPEGFARGEGALVVEMVLGMADVGERGQEYRD